MYRSGVDICRIVVVTEANAAAAAAAAAVFLIKKEIDQGVDFSSKYSHVGYILLVIILQYTDVVDVLVPTILLILVNSIINTIIVLVIITVMVMVMVISIVIVMIFLRQINNE